MLRSIPWCLLGVLALSYVSVARTVELPWSIIDDPASLQIARVLSADWRGGRVRDSVARLFEPGIGRTRPAYIASLGLRSLAGGEDAGRHHFLRLLELVLFVSLLYALVRLATGSDLAAGVGAAFAALGPGCAENWTRLGTAEPLLAFSQALALLLVVLVIRNRGRWTWVLLGTGAMLAVLTATFTKESALFAAIPALLACAWSRACCGGRARPVAMRAWGAYALAVLVAFVAARALAHWMGSAQGSYSDQYVLHASRIAANMPRLFALAMGGASTPLMLAALASFAARTVEVARTDDGIAARWRIGGDGFWQIFGLTFYLGFVLVQSPWFAVLPRYLLPGLVGLGLFLAAEIAVRIRLWQALPAGAPGRGARAAWVVALLVAAAASLAGHLMRADNQFAVYGAREVANDRFLRDAARLTAPGRVVYLNIPDEDLEWRVNGQNLLRLAHGRPDIAVATLDLGRLDDVRPGDLIARCDFVPQRYTDAELGDALGNEFALAASPSADVAASAIGSPLKWLRARLRGRPFEPYRHVTTWRLYARQR